MVQYDLLKASHDKTHDGVSLARLGGQRFCTDDHSPSDRQAWLKEIIGKEYANVDISPLSDVQLFNDMAIYPWRHGMRLSPIQSNAIKLKRLMKEPTEAVQDCYFAVVLTSGKYSLEQAGREVFLQPGDMTLYDATEPHSIVMPQTSSKILISIPRNLLDSRIFNVGKMTAKHIPSKSGIGAVVSSFIQTTVNQLNTLEQAAFLELSDPILDMLTLSLQQLNTRSVELSQHRTLTLMRVKQFVHNHIEECELNAEMISNGVGLSLRYINNLFNAEDTSLMRFLTQQRLTIAKRRLSNHLFNHKTITELAMQSGFNNMAHFSRVFKQNYGVSPRQFRVLNLTHYLNDKA
ncbi:MAG TPA: helix-turn-helix domain-containing protein [Methylophaga sp.]|nr:helix-turn-helix domain-containing protein [Methylophaga sp.]